MAKLKQAWHCSFGLTKTFRKPVGERRRADCHKVAKAEGIKVRQSYVREVKGLKLKQFQRKSVCNMLLTDAIK